MRRELGMLAAFVLMCAALRFSNPSFLGPVNVFNTTREISRLGIYAVGIGIVIVTGGIDLSVGSIIGLTGVIIAKLSAPDDPNCYHYPVWVGITAAMGAAVALGLFQGFMITALKLQPFIVTLGGMLLFRGVAQVIDDNNQLHLGSSNLAAAMEASLWKVGEWTVLSTPVLVFLVVLALGTYLLHFSVFGRYAYAIGGSRDAAEYSGIPVRKVETMAYVLSAALAGVAGVVNTYLGGMDHTNGISAELFAIAAAVIGGCSLRGGEGSIFGVVIGCGIIRVIANGINLFKISYHDAAGVAQEFRIGSKWNDFIIGAVILFAVTLDQVAHFAQARRRVRKAGEVAAAKERAAEHPAAA